MSEESAAKRQKVEKTDAGRSGGTGARYHCDYCRADITSQVHIKCAECKDFDLCVDCFASGVELVPHKNNHRYRVMDHITTPLFDDKWGADEELLLMDAIEMYGFGNWSEVAEHIGSKDKDGLECEEHYNDIYLSSKKAPLPDIDKPVRTAEIRKQEAEEKRIQAQRKKSTTKTKPPKQSQLGQLVGYIPHRGDFETEYENDAEVVLADMEFKEDDTKWEKELKLKVVEIYNSKLDARLERKKFIVERGLLHKKDKKLTKEEKEVYNNLKPFARFHSAEEHEAFVQGIINEQKLRKRIEMLQHHRLSGVRTLADSEAFESLRQKRVEEGGATSSKKGSSSSSSYLSDGRPRSKRASADDKSKKVPVLDISNIEGVELLTPAEQQLCSQLHLLPQHYMVIKDRLIRESFCRGFLQPGQARQLIKIDVNKTDKILDFFVSVGWVHSLPEAATSASSSSSSAAVKKEGSSSSSSSWSSQQQQQQQQQQPSFQPSTLNGCVSPLSGHMQGGAMFSPMPSNSQPVSQDQAGAGAVYNGGGVYSNFSPMMPGSQAFPM